MTEREDGGGAAPEDRPRARVRSFVRRDGRLTRAQREALERLYPHLGIALDTTPIDLGVAFGREAPCCIDIGFGNGASLLWHAERFPEQNFLGVEVYPPGVGRALNSIQAQRLTNVRIVQQDAVEVFEHRLAPGSIDRVMLLFPDPWPKKRHHKRRIVQPAFLDLVGRALRANGVLHMATDWAPYGEAMVEVADAHPALKRIVAEDQLAAATTRPQTHFQRRGERLGHDVVDLAYRRV
ncbi:MAG: tRNA (guanosine(46)-N7)-methyltransferase TrmB [Pseudomonadota bacterium]